MKKKVLIFGLLLLLVIPSTVYADEPGNNGSKIYQFTDEPFDFWRCYVTTNDLSPAVVFGEDVCVHYVALNSETVRFRGSDVSWSLLQHGNATIYAKDDNAVLYAGPFQVEEIARDIGGDAKCVWEDGKHAWIGICANLYRGMDSLNYNWKITGASVYYFNLSISAPGMWCFSSKQGGVSGPGCK